MNNHLAAQHETRERAIKKMELAQGKGPKNDPYGLQIDVSPITAHDINIDNDNQCYQECRPVAKPKKPRDKGLMIVWTVIAGIVGIALISA